MAPPPFSLEDLVSAKRIKVIIIKQYLISFQVSNSCNCSLVTLVTLYDCHQNTSRGNRAEFIAPRRTEAVSVAPY